MNKRTYTYNAYAVEAICLLLLIISLFSNTFLTKFINELMRLGKLM